MNTSTQLGFSSGRPERRAVLHGRTILPAMLRITFSLLLWTLGATMNIAAAQTNEHRKVSRFPIDRERIEAVQRWVNSGRDEWCRDPQSVASAASRRLSAELPGSEIALASLPLEAESARATRMVYSYHSLDGRSTYRITVRRFRWLLPTAGSFRQMIWVPERAEIITRRNLD
jgi:hypothetical protein